MKMHMKNIALAACIIMIITLTLTLTLVTSIGSAMSFEPRYILNIQNSQSIDAEPMMLAGDFNSDGYDDVLIAWSIFGDERTFDIEILLNNKHGGLEIKTKEMLNGLTINTQAFPGIPIVLEDLNGDRKNDVFIAVAGMDIDPFPGYQNLLLLSTKEGFLIDASSNLPQQNDFPHSVTAADIDSDGDVDIYVGNMWAQQRISPQILLNDGNGNFTVGINLLPAPVTQFPNGYTASEFVDINNDSFPDLILGHDGDIYNKYSTAENLVLINNGEGVFSLAEKFSFKKPSEFFLTLDIAAADLNHDSFLDLVITYTGNSDHFFRGRFFQIMINNQDGTFKDETNDRLPNANLENSAYCYWIDLFDMDGDHDLDILARVWDDSNPTPIQYINDGNGYFIISSLDIKIDSLYYAIIDLDNDGGHDFVYGYYGKGTSIFILGD